MIKALLTLIFCATIVNATSTNRPPVSAYITLNGPRALTMYNQLRTNTVARFSHPSANLQTLIDAIADELEDHPAFEGRRFSSMLHTPKRSTRRRGDPFAAVAGNPFASQARASKTHSLHLQHTSFLNLFVALAARSNHTLMINDTSLSFVHSTSSIEPLLERTYRKLRPANLDLIVDIPTAGRGGVEWQSEDLDPFATQTLSSRDSGPLAIGFRALGIAPTTKSLYQYSERSQTLRVQHTPTNLERIDAIIDVISPISDTAHLVNAARVSKLTIHQRPAHEAIDQLVQSTITGFGTAQSRLSDHCNILLVVPPAQLGIPITLTLHNADLRSSLDAICDQTGWRYDLQARQIVFYGGPLHSSEAETQLFRLKSRASRALVKAASASEFFTDLGVRIPQGSALRYIPHAHMLTVRSTHAAITGIKRSLDEVD